MKLIIDGDKITMDDVVYERVKEVVSEVRKPLVFKIGKIFDDSMGFASTRYEVLDECSKSNYSSVITTEERLPDSIRITREQLANSWDEIIEPGSNLGSHHDYKIFNDVCKKLGFKDE